MSFRNIYNARVLTCVPDLAETLCQVEVRSYKESGENQIEEIIRYEAVEKRINRICRIGRIYRKTGRIQTVAVITDQYQRNYKTDYEKGPHYGAKHRSGCHTYDSS